MPHNNYFEFKQFTVWQNHAAMRVGTDGALLGAWATVEGSVNILDIGTGTGVISLMLAQRSGAEIHAIDIEDGAIADATLNFSNSPWHSRLTLQHCSLQDHARDCTTKYDAIVSNPPFFSNSPKPNSKKREMARHTDSLTSIELVQNAAKLLKPDGHFTVILPIDNENTITVAAFDVNLFPTRICRVKPNPAKPTNRVLIEFMFGKRSLIEESLLIEAGTRHVYTSEFTQLMKPFYLHL